jgi:L-asparaginase
MTPFKDKPNAKVFVLYTGGTIGMVPSEKNNPASPLRPGSKEELGVFVGPDIDFDVDGLRDVPPLDSSDVNSDHWLKMAEAIGERYDDYEGFVILHGTDTMAYTASGLSFLLANLAKPVVITGSQLPLPHPRTDARLNLANALCIAGYKASGLPLIPEVVLCFGSKLLRGNRSRKVSTSDLDGFESPNFPPLGRLGEHIEINESLLRPPADNIKEPFYVVTDLVTDVMDFTLFPGLRKEPLKALLESEGLKGVIMRTFGAGNAMSDPDILKVLRSATGKGKAVLNVTQCTKGMVEMGLYAASSELMEMGVISGLDMTPEAALAKMFWILAAEVDPQQVRTQLQISQRGEQSEDLFEVQYKGIGESSKQVQDGRVSAVPAGQFRKEHLKRAVLRVKDLSFDRIKVGDPFEIRAFVNYPSANQSVPTEDPHCAVVFKGEYKGPSKPLIADITPAIRQFAEAGRAITISLVTAGDARFSVSEIFLNLFARSV